MKFVFLETGTSEVQKYGDTLRKLGHEVVSMRYDLPGQSNASLPAKAKEHKPDAIIYIGSRWGQIPAPAIFMQLSARVAPTVLFCSDAADAPWHDLIREYLNIGCFTLICAIDGNKRWPGSAQHMTALTPVDFDDYAVQRPHAERNVIAAFAGNAGGGDNSQRTRILVDLLSRRAIDVRTRSPLPFTYKGYADYLCNLRISLNVAYTGTEQAMHVKGRVVESGLAGCCLLENKGAPTSQWFTPGTDYLEYANTDEAAAMIAELRENPLLTEGYGLRLRSKILAEHTPEKFWARVFYRIGIGEQHDVREGAVRG